MFIPLKGRKFKICEEQIVFVISTNLGHSKVIFIETNGERYVNNEELTEVSGNILTISQG